MKSTSIKLSQCLTDNLKTNVDLIHKCGLKETEAAHYIDMSRIFLSQDRMNSFCNGKTT